MADPVQEAHDRITVRPPQSHYLLADALLQRADKLVEAIDEHDDWPDALTELNVATRLAHAHATLGAAR